MLKKSITYEDFNGNEVTEEFAFHLSKADLIEMEAERRGGLAAYLQHIIDSNDGAAIINAFKDLLLRSIGKVSEDGKRFVKSEETIYQGQRCVFLRCGAEHHSVALCAFAQRGFYLGKRPSNTRIMPRADSKPRRFSARAYPSLRWRDDHAGRYRQARRGAA